MAPLFAATLFISAILLFWVQPLMAKMLLPLLGGTPAVWNTCMLFFQGMLLAGYAYVLVMTRRLGLRRQVILHLALLLVAALALPISISEASTYPAPAGSDPSFWLLGKLLVTVGLPFFIISASAPLLQKWFSRTRHASAGDPYFLYAASNAGSLIALIGFPAIFEPNFSLLGQSRLWAGTYAILVIMIFICAAVLWRSGWLGAAETGRESQAGGRATTAAAPAREITLGHRLRWIVLAFVPSSLVLGVTTYITTDIASTPLLWIIPLSLYLLSFVLAFAKKQLLSPSLLGHILRLAAVIITLVFLSGISEPIWFLVLMHLFFFFSAAMVCHGQLALRRPSADHLTEFYLWIAVGGVLGGIFNALLAPMLFSTVLEYPLAIVLACMMLPRGPSEEERDFGEDGAYVGRRDVLVPLGVGAVTAMLAVLAARYEAGPLEKTVVALAAPLTINYFFIKRPTRFALAIGAVMLGSILFARDTGRTMHAERNFYGTLRVISDPAGPSHMLYHGSTMHGWQFTDQARKCEPLSYYHRTGPLGSIFKSFNTRPASPNVAVVGLGAGAMVAYARPEQKWTFYEIDPAVLRLAQNTAFFTYLQDCAAAPVETVLGDARLQLREAPDGHYGLIVLDAFSSDAVPVHLLTREALGSYMSKMADRGLLAIHISNRSLNLHTVIGDLAKNADLKSLIFNDQEYDIAAGKAPSQWVVLARRSGDLGDLVRDRRWRHLRGRPQPKVWSDDFSDIVSVFKWLG